MQCAGCDVEWTSDASVELPDMETLAGYVDTTSGPVKNALLLVLMPLAQEDDEARQIYRELIGTVYDMGIKRRILNALEGLDAIAEISPVEQEDARIEQARLLRVLDPELADRLARIGRASYEMLCAMGAGSPSGGDEV